MLQAGLQSLLHHAEVAASRVPLSPASLVQYSHINLLTDLTVVDEGSDVQ